MVRLVLFNLLLFGSCFYALAKGTRDARIIAVTTLIAANASMLRIHAYASVETIVLGIDIAVLAVFLFVALRSDRFWPLWISGMQLITTVGHVMKYAQSDLPPIVYAVALRFWSYPIQIILIIAVWRACQRSREAAAARTALH